MDGTNQTSMAHPVMPMSWSLRAVTASIGTRRNNPTTPSRRAGPTSLSHSTLSMSSCIEKELSSSMMSMKSPEAAKAATPNAMAKGIMIRLTASQNHQNSDLLARSEKSVYFLKHVPNASPKPMPVPFCSSPIPDATTPSTAGLPRTLVPCPPFPNSATSSAAPASDA